MKISTSIALFLLACAPLAAQELTPEQKAEYHELVDHPPEIVGGLTSLAKRVVYPPEALRDSIQGKVFVLAFVNEQGKVESTEVLESPHELLSKAASDAVRQVEFTTGVIKGKCVKVKVAVPVLFRFK